VRRDTLRHTLFAICITVSDAGLSHAPRGLEAIAVIDPRGGALVAMAGEFGNVVGGRCRLARLSDRSGAHVAIL